MMHPRTKLTYRDGRERGMSLIIAVVVIVLLTMIGLMVLDSVYSDTQLAGSERSTQAAMYVAEAGAVIGRQMLVDMLFPAGSGQTAPPQVATLLTQQQLAIGDPICPASDTTTVCSNWYQLGVSTWTNYAQGQYRIAATCYPTCSSTASNSMTFSVRSIAKMPDGSTRLIQIDVGQ